MPTIVIAAGGTAGHVVPALAIAGELRASGADVSFVGTRERVESRLVPAAGYEIEHLSLSGLDRRHPGRATIALARAAPATFRAMRLLGRRRADAVLCAGGYTAGPLGVAALLRRTPLVLTEADSRLGLANRMLAPFARRVCLAFPIDGRGGDRYLVTGRAVPSELSRARRASARERLGIDRDARCLLVFGGSLGARSINECSLAAFGERPPRAEGGASSAVLHISGHRDYPELRARLERLGARPHYRLLDWVEGTLADPLAAADLAIARAGGSVFELAATGKPAVLIPYPHATADHQSSNARWFADAGAAVVLADGELDGARLRALVEELLGDAPRLEAMSRAARALARPDAARVIAEQVLEVAGTRAAAAGRHRSPPASARHDEPAAAADPERPWQHRRLHFVGIGGAGMSALALVAHELGAAVSGCDRAEGPYTRTLRHAGIPYQLGHSPDHLAEDGELVVSTAVPTDVPEVRVARERGLPILHRGRLLAEVAALRRLIAVAGTHGKTTTAAMTAHALDGCGLEPSFVVGGELRSGPDDAPANAAWRSGPWLVAETDESDRSFLELSPSIAVVTNLELDHHATYGSLVEVEQAFRSFLGRTKDGGSAVIWDRPELRRLVGPDTNVVTYGVEDPASTQTSHLSARSLEVHGLGMRFELLRDGHPVCHVELPVPGHHNVLNALAALAVCELTGCDLERAARALERFRPAARRFEWRGEGRGVTVFDDYAHHPTEVGATLEAARALGPRRLIAVFQPHLYSRTLHLHRELGRELARADVAVVLDVYAARERPEGPLAGVTGKLVADACADASAGRPVWWLPTLEEAEAVVARQLDEGDLVITLGAGDVDRLAERLAARLDGAEPA